MATESVSFAGTDQNPFTSIPTGWTSYGTWQRLTSLNGIIGNVHGKMLFNTYAAGFRKISATMYYNAASAGSTWSLLFCTPALTGFVMDVTNTAVSLIKRTGDVAGAVIATVALSNTTSAVFDLEYNDTTGAITVKKAGTTVLTGTYTDTPNLLPGIRSYQGGTVQSFRALTIDYTPAQTVTSINGGSPITSSQSAVSASTLGFTGLPTTITTNIAGVTCGTISGTTNAPAWVQTVRTDGAVFPKSGTVVTYTFTKSAETASGTQTINKDADQTAVIVASPINDDVTTLFGAVKAVTGRSAANNDEVYHAIPPAMLTNGIDTILPADAIAPDGTMQFYNAGSFPCWVWTNATGINYYYLVTITESGGIIITAGLTNSPLTSRGLTTGGLTHRGL